MLWSKFSDFWENGARAYGWDDGGWEDGTADEENSKGGEVAYKTKTKDKQTRKQKQLKKETKDSKGGEVAEAGQEDAEEEAEQAGRVEGGCRQVGTKQTN